MKSGVTYCEDVLWELIESGASASDALGGATYSDFLSDAAKKGALAKGRGALVLSSPTSALKSWFELIARKLNSGQKLLSEELVNVSKCEYFSLADMKNLFGKYIAGECEAELNSYNPIHEFIFIRLYLSPGSGDADLLWDAVAYEEPPAELVKKFAPAAEMSLAEVVSRAKCLLNLVLMFLFLSGKAVVRITETPGLRRAAAQERCGARCQANAAAPKLL